MSSPAVTPEPKPRLDAPVQPRLVDELKKMEVEPLLPIEKKLIAWSIGLGLLALGLLVWLSYSFFPSGH